MKYRVSGNITVSVGITVDANSEEEAIERAYEEFGGVNSYAGNNGYNKLIGVDGSKEWIDADGIVEFNKTDNQFYVGDKVKFSLFDGELCGIGIIENCEDGIPPYRIKVIESKDLADDEDYVNADLDEMEHV